MSVADGVQQLKNMQTMIDSWPAEKRENFNMRVAAIKFAARNDPMQEMAVMFAGMRLAVERAGNEL